jgi:ubiquinone/menaquinone biosynthesis C-methylase UbiE
LTEARVGGAPGASGAVVDPYLGYTRTFFRRWAPFYDFFARSVGWVYGAAIARLDARPGTTILDLCAGTGEIALRCARLGAAVHAVDVTPDMIGRARSKARARPDLAPRLRFELADARALPFADAAVDVAVVSFALHDMPRTVALAVLREARRVARHRLVVLDYELPRSSALRAFLGAMIASFETAYFRRFARDGAAPLIAAAGLPSPTRHRLGPVFAVHVVQLSSA